MPRDVWGWLKWLCLAVSAGSFLLAVVFLWIAPKATLTESSEGVTEHQQDTHTEVEKPWVVERKGDRVLWRLQADVAEQKSDGMHLILPILDLFTEKGELVPIVSQKSWFDPIKKDMKFMGDVVVQYQGWVLKTDLLIYESGVDQIHIPGKFEMKREGIMMRGRTMVLDHNSETMTISHDVWVQDARSQTIKVQP